MFISIFNSFGNSAKMSSKIFPRIFICCFIFSAVSASYDSKCSSIVQKPLNDTRRLPPDSIQLPYIYGFSKGKDRVQESKLKFTPYYISETNAANILHVEAYLILSSRSYVSIKKQMFQVFGYWSQTDSKLCMVETKPKIQVQSLALLLNLTKSSSISNTLVKGTLINTDSNNNTNYISLLGYNQNNYKYIAKDGYSCSRVNEMKNSLSLPSNHAICSTLHTLNRATFELEYDSKCGSSNCNPLGKVSIDFLPQFMTIIAIKCSNESKFQMYMTFWNTTIDTFYPPKYTIISEAFWDAENNRLCGIGCKVENSTLSLADSYVHDCNIGISLSITETFSIVDRSSVTGRIWSTHNNTDDLGYFESLSFHSLNTFIDNPGLKYEYRTEKNACNSTFIDKKMKYIYPNPATFNKDMEFNFQVKYNGNWGAPGYFSPLFIGNMQYSDAHKRSHMQLLHLKRKMWNISYEIGFQIAPDSIWRKVLSYGSKKLRKISAEGTYNSDTGQLCMIACRYIPQNVERHDCEVSINIQFPPMNPTSRLRSNVSLLAGSIKSTRDASDPLYFEKLNIVSHVVYARQAEAAVRRMDFEIAMVLISLTLISVFAALQIYHVKKNRESLPSVSVLTVAILTIWIMLRLVFGQRNKSVLIQRWFEADEVILRVITVIAFVLLLWLLKKTVFSKFSAADNRFLKAEVKAFTVCASFYVIGGFVAWYANKSMKSYLRLVVDGFLMPQVMFNVFMKCERKALAEAVYVGITVVRVFPRLYDIYRYRAYLPLILEAYDYVGMDMGSDLYLPVWDVVIVCMEVVLGVVVFVQQRRAGGGGGGEYKPVEVQMS